MSPSSKDHALRMKLWEQVIYDPAARHEICKLDYEFFGKYYMSDYFTLPSPLYQSRMFYELKFPNGATRVLWRQYRESTKTTLARVKVVADICYEARKNIKWISHVEPDARVNMYAVARQLQGNRRIREDFGQLYFDDKLAKSEDPEDDMSRIQTIADFQTRNGVRVSAKTPRKSTRGNLSEDGDRPDLCIIDDVENNKTKKSVAMTDEIITFLDETMTGGAAGCQYLILGNWLTEHGVIADMMNRAKANPKYWIVNTQRIIETDENGEQYITWPDRFVFTDEEMAAHNKKEPDEEKWVQSIPFLKREYGTALYEQEYMLIPISEGERLVKREWFREWDIDRMVRDEDGTYHYTFDGVADPVKGKLCTIMVDPSISKKETADPRAMMTMVSFDLPVKTAEGDKKLTQFFVIRTVAGRWGLKEFGTRLLQQRDSARPHEIGVENNGVQEAFREYFSDIGIHTKPQNPDADKVRRFSAHLPEIENRRVWFPNDGSEEETIREICDFVGDDSRHDDRVDVFTYSMKRHKRGRAFVGAIVLD